LVFAGEVDLSSSATSDSWRRFFKFSLMVVALSEGEGEGESEGEGLAAYTG